MGKVTKPGTTESKPYAASAFVRPLRVFYDQTNLYSRFKEGWSWGWAYVYAAGGLLGGNLMALPSVSRLVRANLEVAQVPQSVVDFDMQLILISNLALPFATPLIQAFLMALVIHFLCLPMDVRVRFSKLFSLVMHSFLPTYLAGQMVKGAIALFVPPDQILQINISPSVLLPSTMRSSWLHTLLSTLDVFIISSLVLVGIGFVIAQKQPKVRGVICAAALYGVILAQTFVLSPSQQ